MPCAIFRQRVVVPSGGSGYSRPLIVGNGNAAFLSVVGISLVGITPQFNASIEQGDGLDQWALIGSLMLVTVSTAPGLGFGVIAPLASVSAPNNVAIGTRFIRARVVVRDQNPNGTGVAEIYLRTARV